MESLTVPSLKGVCLDKHRGLSLCCKDDVGRSTRSEICFVGLSSSKLSHISLLSVQRKTIQPISCAPALHPSSDSQTPTPSEETETTNTNESALVRVKFKLNKDCSFGQHFLIVGDDPVLGSWNPSNAVPLEWSEGHVWTVELDIPSGKTISYKFILKEDANTILWQQGPDRILQTWETKKMVTVSEDWDNVELQKIVEEEPVAEESQESAVNPEILAAENLVPPVVDLENGQKNNENLAVVAENINETKEDVNNDNAFNQNEEDTAKSIGRVIDDQVLSSKDESTLATDEKVPVLVPGLFWSMEKVVAERSKSNVLLDEVQMDKVAGLGSEFKNVAELTTDLTHPKEKEMMVDGKQDRVHANEEKPELVEGRGDRSSGKPMEEVFESDMQWGKRTLHKFFATLGFLKVELN